MKYNIEDNGILNDLSTQNYLSWWIEETYLDFGTYNLGQITCGGIWMEWSLSSESNDSSYELKVWINF